MKEVEFLQYILENIVSKPEEINIEKIDDELGTLLQVSVAKDDMWLIIGKAGSTVSALRSMVRLAGMKQWRKVNLKINW